MLRGSEYHVRFLSFELLGNTNAKGGLREDGLLEGGLVLVNDDDC